MFARGDFITPYFNGVPRFEKPVLIYWLQAATFAALGESELAARLPAALAGLGTVVLLYLLAAHLLSRRAAVVAALVLATMFQFVVFARKGLTDAPALFFVVAALYGFVRATSAPASRVAVWLAWSAIGLGVLTKGPVGLLPLAIWGAYAAICRDWQFVTALRPVAGGALAAVIALPWYLAMVALHGRAFFDFAIGNEIVARVFVQSSTVPVRGFFYYFKVWPGDAAPWSLLFVASAIWAAARWRRFDAPARRVVVLAVTWFVVVFVLFSLSKFKVSHYVLPAYPAAALLIGLFVDRLALPAFGPWWWRVPMSVVAAVSLAAPFVLAPSLDLLMPETNAISRALLPAILGVGGGALALAVWRLSLPVTATALALTLSIAFAVIGSVIVPATIERLKPMASLGRAAEHLAEPSTAIGLLGRYGASSLIYYSHHNVAWLADEESTVAFLSSQRGAVCVMPAVDFDRLAERLPTTHVVASAEEFSFHIQRVLARRTTPGRRWVLVANEMPVQSIDVEASSTRPVASVIGGRKLSRMEQKR
jgi:4-amino-4-deoxy-L-arabinose transferase-like glycosyltransferase